MNSVQTEALRLPEDRIRDASPFEVICIKLVGPLHLRDEEKGGSCCTFVQFTGRSTSRY